MTFACKLLTITLITNLLEHAQALSRTLLDCPHQVVRIMLRLLTR
jgi:hypothetical protein